MPPDLRVARAVDDRIHIHVTGDVRREFGAIAGENVDHAAGQIARRDDLGEGQRGQRLRRRGDHDRRVARSG